LRAFFCLKAVYFKLGKKEEVDSKTNSDGIPLAGTSEDNGIL